MSLVALGMKNPQEHLAVVQNLVSLMDRRIETELLEKNRDQLVCFTRKVPLIVVVLEELPGIIASMPDTKTRNLYLSGIRRLVSEGAKVGIRTIAIAQRWEAAIIPGTIRAQLGVRFLGRSDNKDSIRMLFDMELSDSLIASFPRFLPGVGVVQVLDNAPTRMRAYSLESAKYEDPYQRYCSTVRKTPAAKTVLSSLPIQLGVDENGDRVVWDIIKQSTGGMAIGGMTRSGKTYLAYSILMQLAEYRPLVKVVGCDLSSLLLAPFSRERRNIDSALSV